MFNTTEIAKGVNVFTRKTDQFKTVNISIRFKKELSIEDTASRTVLTNVLQHSNATFKTAAAVRMYLDDLYGTVLYLDTTKKGNEEIVLLNIETVNDQYLKHDNVLDKVLELIHTVLFKPNLENGAFVSSIVAREKAMVIDRIQSIFDEKSRYAQVQLQKLLRPNHPASISVNGTVEAVNAITPESLVKTYKSMLENDAVDIFVVGDIDEVQIIKTIKTALPLADRATPYVVKVVEDTEPITDYKKEQMDMRQAKLHIGYSTPVKFGDIDFPKMQIFNGIFGGYPSAKLFVNVREKESLAYYCGSSYSSQYGLVYVTSGIESQNEEKASRLIDEQLTAIQLGDISDMELDQTKAMLTNQLTEALDSARGQIEIYDQYRDLPGGFSVPAMAEKWAAVTKEDVANVAKNVRKETVFFLTGMEEA
ncbi:EF-P 5-aminopentanol modification-associated protein YfmF [Kurthia sibirica]|uniref:Insulinase family protein n=1 Tax=Kurthia sibirica TaxID=202750 RepID=A0A2U3AQY9_9BACL|nr:pitrilysin family protein [Kurthia sibirica]PWI26953.1 insulinase family protein [Kurthia sibirica]GEK32502.1 putative inactive metalloprotease YmfF [Kurthia sibirica]